MLQKAGFDVDLTAHAHIYYVLEPGKMGNPCPAIGGGGPEMDSATVMVLQKDGKELTLKVFNTKGETILLRRL